MYPEIIFAFKVAISALVGGGWVAATTVLAQRFGSKAGGIIAGIPSVLLVALLFIGVAKGEEAVVAATTIIPASLGTLSGLMATYAVLARRGLAVALLAALFVWTAFQCLLVSISPIPFAWSLSIAGVALGLGILIFEFVLKVPSVAGVSRLPAAPHAPPAANPVALRAILGSLVVASAILAAEFSGPLLGGILSAFPAMVLTTLFLSYRQLGCEFSRAIAKTHMIGGIINCCVYTCAVRYFYLPLGLVGGTIAAYAVVLVTSAVVYWFVRRFIR